MKAKNALKIVQNSVMHEQKFPLSKEMDKYYLFTRKPDNLERQLPFWPGKCFMIKLLSVNSHRVKSVHIRSYSVPYFPAFGMNSKSISLYSVQMRENTDQNNSEYRHFSCSE